MRPGQYEQMMPSSISVVETSTLLKGEIIVAGRTMYLGTRPWTEIERAGYRAKWLVQQGLIDVLIWLGEKPIPKHPPQTTVMDLLRKGYEVELPGWGR